MLVHRLVFEKIGLFDTNYYMYFEDADFCRRARQAGFTVGCVPQAKMWHKVSASADRDKPSARYRRTLNRVHFYRSFSRGWQVPVVWAFTTLQGLRTGLLDLIRGDTHLLRPLLKGLSDGWYGQ